MARPLVLVYQQIAQIQGTPVTPDLNTIVLGPSYDIRDYPDDAATILLDDTYGRLEQPAGGSEVYTPPGTGEDAVTVNAYPEQSPGSVVDHSAVRVYLGLPRVVLGSTHGVGPNLGTHVTTTSADRSLIAFPAGDLQNKGVRPGDRIVITSSSEQSVVRTIATVAEPNAAGLGTDVTLCRITQVLPDPDTAATGTIVVPAGTGIVGAKATGTISAIGGSSLIDGEIFMISDGVNPSTVFEFDNDSSVSVGNVAVPFTGADSAGTVRNAIVAAINSVGSGLRVTASPVSVSDVSLLNDRALAAGNIAITDTVANVGFTHAGMTGGVNDGELLVIDDGVNPAVTFEFDRDGVVTGGHVAVVTASGDSAAAVRDALLAAILTQTGGGALDMDAVADGTDGIGLTNLAYGVVGNVAMTETVAAAGFVVTGMTGGLVSDDGWSYDALGEARIERTLASQELVDADHAFITFPTPGSDTLVLKGGVELSLSLSPVPTVATPVPTVTTVSRSLSYATLYLAYRALRQDISEPLEITNDLVVTSAGVTSITGLGRVDARNPLAAALFVALQNSGGAAIWALGVNSDDAGGHTEARGIIASRRDFYCLVPLTANTSILAAYKFDVDNLADPATSIRDQVPQRFRMVLGSGTLPVTTVITEGTIHGVAQQPGTSSGHYRTLTFANAAAIDLTQVLPGDTLILGVPRTGSAAGWQARRGAHRVSHVNASYQEGGLSNLEIDPGTSRWNSALSLASADIELQIKAPDGTVKVAVLGSADMTQNGGTITWAMKQPTQIGGPYTIQYVSGSALAIRITGFAIVVTFVTGVTTHSQVAALATAHAVIGGLLTATWDSAGTVINGAIGATAIEVAAASVSASVIINDNLYDRFEDTTALFITSDVKAGDVIEIPIDANDYTSAAFSGRLLSYRVAQVINENRALIQNGLDDTASASNELPHKYMRDIANRLIDNTYPNALRYRIRRPLSKDDQVTELTSLSQSFRTKRVVLLWPDSVKVDGLVDGSLVRAVSTVPESAGWVSGFYAAAMIGGALAGLPVQHGLTNLGFAGVTDLRHSNGYFSEPQLSRLSDGGWFVLHKKRPSDLVTCLHQLTTDTTAVETGEVSVVRNLDFLSMFLQDILEEFLGQYNVLPETSNEMSRALSDGMENLKGRKLAHFGAPLLEGTVTLIKVADFARDRYQIYVNAEIPRPLNAIDLYVVV